MDAGQQQGEGKRPLSILQMSTESCTQMVFVLPIARHLRAQGHQVVLACSEDTGEAGKSFVGDLRAEGFEVLILPIKRTISPWSDFRAVVELYRHLRRRRFDVVHTQTAKAGMIGRIAGFLARVPRVVYTAHAFPFHELLPRWQVAVYAFLERSASPLCDAIAVDSACVRDRGLAFKVAPPDKIRVIPMGIDTDRFDPARHAQEGAPLRAELGIDPKATLIGAIARFVDDKGLDELIQAVALLAPKHPDLRCLLVGDGPLNEALRALVQELGLEGKVIFAGFRTDIPRVLSALDLFVLPTRREGFGVAFAEAMSMEVPVVGLHIPPMDELIVDGEVGALAEDGSAEAFARAMEPLLGDPALRHRLGVAARQRVVAHFGQSVMCRDYEGLFLGGPKS